MSMDAESQLIDRCRKGEAAAWDELFEAHYAATGRFVFQVSPALTREDVEEICQETFLAVIRHLGSFHGGSRLQTWIFRIASNKARDYGQRQRAAKRGGGLETMSLQGGNGESQSTIDPTGRLAGPDELLMEAERAAQIGRALEQLEGPCREIIELRYFGDLSYEEISAALQLNPKTVSARLSKCLDRLEAVAMKIFGMGKRTRFPSNDYG
jgi:RNA polymerase sigma-70 factor (ECF subfamily)